MAAIYKEYVPPSRLAEYVECFWSLEATSDTKQLVVPDGCMDILLRLDDGVYAFDVIGSMTSPEEAFIRAGHTYIGARFSPGRLRQVLRVNCMEILNSAMPVQNSSDISIAAFSKNVRRPDSIEEKLEVFKRNLTVKIDPLPAQKAINAIVASTGNISVAELADIAQLSERQLRRQCIQLTGLSPKVLSRVMRFRSAFRMLQSTSPISLAQIALDCGYSDQAHFSHEFSQFAGHPPSSHVV